MSTTESAEEAPYWAMWLDPRSGAVSALCSECGQEAVLCTLDGDPVRAYHHSGVTFDPAQPCPVLIPLPGADKLSADILPKYAQPARADADPA